MTTPNSSKVAAGEKRGASKEITPMLDSLYDDADMPGIMTRSRLKHLRNITSSANMRRALLSCFEDLRGNALLESTSPSNKKSQEIALLEAGSVTPSDNDSTICESKNLRIERSLKLDNDDKQDCTNANKAVSVTLYNTPETERPFVTLTFSGLCNNIKAAIMIHDVKKGSKEVCDTEFKGNSSLLTTDDDEKSPKSSKKERKAIKSRKKSRPSLNENEWTVTAVSEHIIEYGNESDVVKFPQESDEGPLRNTELINGPSLSPTNDELSPNNSQKEIKKSKTSKSSSPNEICKVTSVQKFKRCNNIGDPIVRLSPHTAECEECMKSGFIRLQETLLKNSTELKPNTMSELNTPLSGIEALDHTPLSGIEALDHTPLSGIEALDHSLIPSDKGEPCPDYSATERKARKSRKGDSNSKGDEGTVTEVSEHITAIENEIGVGKTCQGSDKCSLKSTEPQDGPSLTFNDDESSPRSSHKKSKLKNSRKSKSPRPNKNLTELKPNTMSELNTPLSGIEALDHSLIPSDKGEPSPDYKATKRKAKKSRKGNLKGDEGTVTTVSEHVTAFENEIGVVETYQGSDKCSLKSTEPQDGPSLTFNGDESSPSRSHKESKLKKSRKSKSSPPNKNEWTISEVPEGITELGNIMSKVKPQQKFNKCKNRGNPIMTVSQLPAEFEVCPKSIVIRQRETQLKNFSDTEYALVDKACDINNTSGNDPDTRQLESNHNAKSSPILKSKKTEDVRSESSESDSDAESRKAIMESAQRRIMQNISTSESESKKCVWPCTVSNGSDTSDSAPEVMSFSAGRQLVMESWKNATDSIQREKRRIKEKRKERLEKYKQQKEEKLIRLKEKRASQEDASCSSSEESILEKSNIKTGVKCTKETLGDLSHSKGKRFHLEDEEEPKGMKAKKRKNEHQNLSQHGGNLKKLPDDVLENLPDQVPMKLQNTGRAATSEGKRSHVKLVADKTQEYKKKSDIDYIPLSTCGATEFGVMPLDKFMKAPKSMAERAAEFRHNMLYGSRIRRGPANAQAIYRQKLKAAGRDRFLR